jgi:DNA-binding CsgD family transcriptional regulator
MDAYATSSPGFEAAGLVGATDARFVIGGTVCVVVRADAAPPQCARVGALVLGGRRFLVVAVSDSAGMTQSDIVDVLSPRELEIAFHVASGSDCKVVARRLRISFHTVRVHLGRIYAKLGLHKQTELAALMAARFGAAPVCRSPGAFASNMVLNHSPTASSSNASAE